MVDKSINVQQGTKKNKKDNLPEPSFFDSMKIYFKGVRSESHKVTWPDRQQIIRETLVVIAVTTLVTLMIFIIDLILRFLFGFVTFN